MSTDCYVITAGEVVLLQGLSNNEFNGAVAVVEGVSEQRVVVRLLHNKRQILVKPENLLEAGGTIIGFENDDVDDGCDYDSDGLPESDEMQIEPNSTIDRFCSQKRGTDDPMSSDGAASRLESIRETLMTDALGLAYDAMLEEVDGTTERGQHFIGACHYCLTTISENPDNWLAYEVLGDLHSICNSDIEAIEAFIAQTNILLRIYSPPRSRDILEILTVAFLKIAAARHRLQDLEGEMDAFVQVTLTDPTNVHVFASIGDLYVDSGNVTKALSNFREAVRIDPTWALGRFHIARVLLINGDTESAVQELRFAANNCESQRSDESTVRAAKTFIMIAGMIDKIGGLSESMTAVKALLRCLNLLTEGLHTGQLENDSKKLLAIAYYQLGQILGKLGATSSDSLTVSFGYYDGAISSFKMSCELDPSEQSYQAALGSALRLRAKVA